MLPGTLQGIASLQSRFGHILGVGTTEQLLNRVSIGYDTRDDMTAPRPAWNGWPMSVQPRRQWPVQRIDVQEVGVDGRDFWQISPDTILATHVSLRYLPTAHDVPFWALSSLGGDQSADRRRSAVARLWLRDVTTTAIPSRPPPSCASDIATINAVSSHVELELTPFVDVGRVFSQPRHLSAVAAAPRRRFGVRGIARPFVVGYVDFGYGTRAGRVHRHQLSVLNRI